MKSFVIFLLYFLRNHLRNKKFKGPLEIGNYRIDRLLIYYLSNFENLLVLHFQLIHLYYFICLVLASSTAATLSLSIFSTFWEGSSLNLSQAKLNLPTGLRLTEYMGGRIALVHSVTGNTTSKVAPWPNNPDLLTNTHSGLWTTCLAFTGEGQVLFIIDDK